MDQIRVFFHAIRSSELGATATEYGLIAALISITGIAAMIAIGGSLDTIFSSVSTVMEVGVSTAVAGAAQVTR